jgi:hypothetical protein
VGPEPVRTAFGAFPADLNVPDTDAAKSKGVDLFQVYIIFISGFPDKDISRDKDISGPGSFLQIPGIIERGD